MPPDRLRAARRARGRLSAAGWAVAVTGLLMAATILVLAPFFFPFGLAGGALAMLAGRQLVRLRGAFGALLAAGASLLVAGGAAVAVANGGGAGWLGMALAIAQAILALTVLVILYVDAGYLPSAEQIEND